jgi:YggT family protein
MRKQNGTQRPLVGLFEAMRPATFSALISNGRTLMRAVLDIILLVLQIYIWLLIAAAVLSWLIAFNVVNTRNAVVAAVGDFLYRITEPLLRPIRSMLPHLGGIDISPVILILIILLIENIIVRYIYPNVF